MLIVSMRGLATKVLPVPVNPQFTRPWCVVIPPLDNSDGAFPGRSTVGEESAVC